MSGGLHFPNPSGETISQLFEKEFLSHLAIEVAHAVDLGRGRRSGKLLGDVASAATGALDHAPAAHFHSAGQMIANETVVATIRGGELIESTDLAELGVAVAAAVDVARRTHTHAVATHGTTESHMGFKRRLVEVLGRAGPESHDFHAESGGIAAQTHQAGDDIFDRHSDHADDVDVDANVVHPPDDCPVDDAFIETREVELIDGHGDAGDRIPDRGQGVNAGDDGVERAPPSVGDAHLVVAILQPVEADGDLHAELLEDQGDLVGDERAVGVDGKAEVEVRAVCLAAVQKHAVHDRPGEKGFPSAEVDPRFTLAMRGEQSQVLVDRLLGTIEGHQLLPGIKTRTRLQVLEMNAVGATEIAGLGHDQLEVVEMRTVRSVDFAQPHLLGEEGAFVEIGRHQESSVHELVDDQTIGVVEPDGIEVSRLLELLEKAERGHGDDGRIAEDGMPDDGVVTLDHGLKERRNLKDVGHVLPK